MAMTLRAARINAGYTQEQAASLLHVSKDTLRNWEMARTFPDAQKIRDIEQVYKVGYNELIFLPRDYA